MQADGRIVIGLTEDELARYEPGARKLGPRGLAVCAVQGALGATTVGGTLVRFLPDGPPGRPQLQGELFT